MKQRRTGWALLAGALAFSTTALAAPPTAEMLSLACAGCHGTNGGSAGLSMPSLASQSKTAIVDAMKKFKSGERPSTVMGRLAKGYTDADFDAMGSFFSKQKFHPTTQVVDKTKVAKGADLQEANCSRCHLDDGKDGKDDTPVMASQWLRLPEDADGALPVGQAQDAGEDGREGQAAVQGRPGRASSLLCQRQIRGTRE